MLVCLSVCPLLSSTSHGLSSLPSIPMDSFWPGGCFKNSWKGIRAKKILSWNICITNFLSFRTDVCFEHLAFRTLVIPNTCHSKRLSFWILTLPLPLTSHAGVSMECRRHLKSKYLQIKWSFFNFSPLFLTHSIRVHFLCNLLHLKNTNKKDKTPFTYFWVHVHYYSLRLIHTKVFFCCI